jgi:hypothetical protein
MSVERSRGRRKKRFFEFGFQTHTSRSAATSGYKRDTVLWSSDGGRRGTLLPFRTCFQKWPQVQDQRSSLLEQPHSGHRIRGPDGSSLFS